MAAYQPRRAPNVSQYIANLNTIPSAQDAAQQDFALTDDGLDLFTNTEFFDFDMAQSVPTFESDLKYTQGQSGAEDKTTGAMDGPGYSFTEFQTFPPGLSAPDAHLPTPPTDFQAAYAPQAQPLHYSSPASGSTASTEEQSRVAVEEDKRRRNTAASARFRVKKKQREQALEQQTRDMGDRVRALEQKVGSLEMENTWLKGLITEKGGRGGDAAVVGESGEGHIEEVERSLEARKDGVGTEAEKAEA